MVSNYASEYDAECHLDACKTQPAVTDSERGEVFCGGCGLVLVQSAPDVLTDGRLYIQDRQAERTRVGPASSLTIHDRGLSTVIGKDVDATGHAVSSSTRETFNRLRIWDQRSRTRSSSSLAKALVILNATKTKLGIPNSVFEDAASIYRKAVSAKLTRGRTTQSLVAASLYAACRRTGTPRSLDDVAGAANVAKRVLSRDLRVLIRNLDMDLNQYDASAFVVRLANNLNLRERIKRDALDIQARSEEEGITVGKHPVAQAAASLYLSCIMNGEKITQKGFAQVAGVSDVTIRNRMAQIREALQMH